MKKAQIAAIKMLERPDGTILQEDVLRAAQDPKNPIHNHPKFRGWDMSKLAHERLLEVCAEIIKEYRVQITVTNTTRRIEVPYYQRNPEAETRERGYRSLTSIAEDPVLQRKLLANRVKQARSHVETCEALASKFGMDHGPLTEALVALNDFLMTVEPPVGTLGEPAEPLAPQPNA